MFKSLSRVLVILILFAGALSAANIKVITKYGKTGGIAGKLNTTADKVNGRLICQNNPTPGCDFANNPQWSDNGTPNDGSDDTYSGDLLVRTNDSFELIAAWSWNGAVDAGEDTITLKSTLPQGYVIDDLPGACDSSLSSISNNGRDIVCVRKDVDKNKVGTVAEDLTFSIRVLGSNQNGAKPGDISFEISAPNATTQSDNAGVSLTVTAAPRWNLQKSYYWSKTGYTDTQTNKKGYLIYYKYYIEVDEVDGEDDTAPGFLGTESMGGDATFTFTDDLSKVSPNAKLVECKADTWSSSNDPIPYYYSSDPDRSVATPKGRQVINCSQSRDKISVNLQHVDATLNHIPHKDRNNRALPVNRAIAAIGVIEVFVPIDDVKAGKDGNLGTSDDGSLPTVNKLTDFDPTAPSGNSNFGTNTESEKDNSYAFTLYASRGSFNKGYTTKHGLHVYHPGGATYWRTGDGLLTANAEFASRLSFSNNGGTDLTGVQMCDVIDANRMEIIDVTNPVREFHSGPFDYYGTGGFDASNLEFEYASTYENDSWLPSKGGNLDVSHGADVAKECAAPASKWYSTPDEARSHGLHTITKVRIKVKDGVAVKPGEYMYVWLNHRVRAKDLSGNPLQNGDEIVNYGSVKDNEYYHYNNAYDGWYTPTYIPHSYPNPPEKWTGDRVTFTGGKVRIKKSVDKNSVEPGNKVHFTLDASYTNDTGTSEKTDITIKDLLPKGLRYVSGSTINAPEPTIGTCSDVSDLGESCTNDNQILIWHLGQKTANVDIPDINYTAQVKITAPQGTMTNYAYIEAPSDASAISQRRSDVNLNVTIPATINLSKEVLNTTPQEPNGAPIEYAINARNGSSVSVSDLDIIDILPFNGDGDAGAIKFRDLNLKRRPGSNYHGNTSISSVELIAHPDSPSLCDVSGGVTYYYTNEPPKNINMSPKDTSNALGGNSIWCEGDKNGPAASCGFSAAEVTAIRAKGPSMDKDAVCQMKISMSVNNNQPDDFYNNSAGASATGVTLPVLSNAATTVIVKSSLGNYVWFDANANGIQDASEVGINDVSVSLYKADGILVKTIKTADDENGNAGYYKFENLHSGDYYIQITPPTNYQISPKDAGADDAKDSDIDTNGKTATIHLAANSEDLSFDAGLYKTHSIGDTIWYDSDRDGIQDPNEDCKYMDLSVKLLDANNQVIATQTTNNCHYLFTGLAQGSYKVQFTLPTGFEATTKNSGNDRAKDSNIDTNTLTSDVIVLANGIDDKSVDFGYFTKTSIGDLVWIDTNANGIQDASEVGLDGVEVKLYDHNNALVESKITANGGKYLFENLSSGDYKVKFTLPAGYSLTDKDKGNDDSKDSDVKSSFLTPTITLVDGQEDLSWDMGVYKKASITDKIWIDSNNNGIQDNGESCNGIDILVTIQELNISHMTSNCQYTFNDLKPGHYHVKFTLPQGYTTDKEDAGDDNKDSDVDENGLSHDITLLSGSHVSHVDAGLLKNASLGDKIWLDTNVNGIQDSGERGLKDINVTLFDSADHQVAKTSTDANGKYLFKDLKPAQYKIQITLPDGYKVSLKDAGGDDTKDSDIDPTTLKSDLVTLQSGENKTTVDGGVYSISSIGDLVWLDTNANGIQDAGEKGIKDITVTLLKEDNSPTGKTTKTDENGRYIFENLVSSTYKVKFTLPQGFEISPKDVGSDDNKDSDVDTGLVSQKITLGVNQHITDVDMGIFQRGSIGDKIWIDSNDNGIQDTDESCEGKKIEVTLIDSQNHEQKQTSQNCSYKFENLIPGIYKIKATLPKGYTPTLPNAGDDNKDSDIDLNGISNEITLHSNEHINSVDIGIVKDGSLGDRIWLDSNKNGIQDEGEKGIEGVKVTLLDANSSSTGKTVTTNSDGIYAFIGIKPASYKIKITLPQGYHVSPKNIGDEDKDSDLDANSLESDTFVVHSGASESRVDVGLYTNAELGDRVWLDTNANGIQDEGEKGIAGVELTLLDKDSNPYQAPVTTDENGKYLFKSLPSGKYSIKVTLPKGYKISPKDVGSDDSKDSDIDPVSKVSSTITLDNSAKDHTVDIGLYKEASVGDSIWLDSNNNGIQDSEEDCNDLSILVELQDANGSVKASQKTKNCHYLFEHLVPQTYKVVFHLPKSTTAAKEAQGNDRSKDSDINKKGVSQEFTLSSNEHKTDIDAGFLQNGSIGDFVWLDANTNGIQDEGEKGIKGIKVTLLNGDGSESNQSTTTDADGHYQFTNLSPANYALKITLPKGYVVTNKDVGNDDTKDSDLDKTTLTTAITTLDSGEDDSSWDMGIYALGKLGDRVWLDTNANGIQDKGEIGIKGITVTLLNEDGSSTNQSIKTDENGKYLFTGLVPKNYKVQFEVPQGYRVTFKNKTDDDKDSDVDLKTKTTDTIKIESGANKLDVDMGLIALKSISGKVEADINADKKADKALKDVNVWLKSCNNDNNLSIKQKTDAKGAYKFEGLIPGCYIIHEEDPKGYTSVSDVDGDNDNNITVRLTTKDITKRNFLDEPLLKISGHVRADMDFDGDIEVESSKDKVLSDVNITLYHDDKKIATTKTDENGSYEFGDITPGKYIIQESDPKGFDSLRDVDGENDNNISVTLSQKDITDRDFDDQKTILVSGTIKVDIDGDRIVDEPLKDTQLLLCKVGEVCTPEQNIATTYTDVNGSYEFDGLKPGNFVIVEVDKPGYESLKDKDGGNDNTIHLHLDGLKDVKGQDFEDLAVAPMFIKIHKSVAKHQTHIGDFVSYTIEIENVNKSFNYASVKIKDTLPAGFKYVKNSARLLRDKVKEKIKASGKNIVKFGEFALKAKEKVKLSYLLKVGVSVAKGDHVNSAIAIQNDKEVSNTSKASVEVISDPFVDNAVVVGKVFEDKNGNGIQDKGERGIPGVRLATVTGMLIETDGYGRYHIADVKSGGFASRGKNMIVKVDKATLPKGAKFTTENPRVYRITSGELNVINFGVKLPKQEKLTTSRKITKIVMKKRLVKVNKSIKIGSIYFDSDQDCIRPDQVQKMRKIANKIKEYKSGSIIIEGNTDARAPIWYNKKLAYKRAKSVYDELKHILGDKLIDKVDVIYDSCGKEMKFDPRYDWWGKRNIPRTKKECTRFGISKKECNRVLKSKKGGAL